MKAIIKNVISRGGYDLTAILRKVDTLWAEGRLSDEERAELTRLARNGADVTASVDVVAKLVDLEKRVKALEGNESTTEEYPEYVVGAYYYNGDKVSFEGVNYVCIAPENTVCVWSPKDYPAYWQEV